MSKKGDCIREARDSFKDAIEDANDAALICVEKFLFFCVESKLDRDIFKKLKETAQKALDADIQACEELPSGG